MKTIFHDVVTYFLIQGINNIDECSHQADQTRLNTFSTECNRLSYGFFQSDLIANYQ